MNVSIPPEKYLIVPIYPIWRLSVEQYHAMIEAGILADDDPVELLEGWLVAKMPKNRPHSLATQLTRDALARLVPAGWYVDAQEPITMADSEPEPDIIVVRGERHDYVERQPYPADVGLVVEVADATLQRDRRLKLRLYADAGIVCYWIINLPQSQIEVYTDPAEKGDQAHYRQRSVYTTDDTLPVMLDGQEVGWLPVRDLLS